MTSRFKNCCCENMYTGTNTSEKFIASTFLSHTEDGGISSPRYVGTSDTYIKKGKFVPVQTWTKIEGCRKFRLPGFQESRCMKIVILSAHRIKSIKNPNGTIINRILDFPACGAVPQTTSLPRTRRLSELRIQHFLAQFAWCKWELF
jgi:hypothetical protein